MDRGDRIDSREITKIPSSIRRAMQGPATVDISMNSAPQNDDQYSMGSGSNTFEEIWDVEDDNAADPDPRVVFLYMYLNRAFKIKSDRWAKVISSDDSRKIIFNFLDKPDVEKLIFTLPSPGYLLPTNEFPWNPKVKCSYFIKMFPCAITKENIHEVLRFGDFSPQPIEELMVMLEEVHTSVIADGPYKDDWDDAMATDIKGRIHEITDVVVKLKHEMKGEPRLIIPPEIGTVYEELLNVKKTDGKSADPRLRRIYERAILGWWIHLTDDILLSKPMDMYEAQPHPLPQAEFTYWENRVRVLEEIYLQLSEPRVKTMLEILEHAESKFLACFRECLSSVVEALDRARNLEYYLSALRKQVDLFQGTAFQESENIFYPLIYTLGLIWVNCPGFNESNEHVCHIINLLNNMVIAESYKEIDPGVIFQGDVDDNLPKVNKCVKNIKKYKDIFLKFSCTLRLMFPEGEEVRVWKCHPVQLFERYNKHEERTAQIEFCLEKWSAYQKLEKIAVGGFYSENLTIRLERLALDFEDLLNIFRNVAYDPGDIDDLSWDADFDHFRQVVDELDNRFAAIASLTFDDCSTFEEIFKMIYLFQPFFNDIYVIKALEPKYEKIAELFRSEVINAFKLYNDQMEKYKHNGLFEVPTMWPQTSGSLLWLRNIKKRLQYPLENMSTYRLEATNTEDAMLLRRKASELLGTILDMEAGCRFERNQVPKLHRH